MEVIQCESPSCSGCIWYKGYKQRSFKFTTRVTYISRCDYINHIVQLPPIQKLKTCTSEIAPSLIALTTSGLIHTHDDHVQNIMGHRSLPNLRKKPNILFAYILAP